MKKKDLKRRDNELNETRLNKIIHRTIRSLMYEARERKHIGDGHKAYHQRMCKIDSIVRSTMKDLSRLLSEKMRYCASSLYQEGVADAEQIVYLWEREICNAICSQEIQKKFFQEA